MIGLLLFLQELFEMASQALNWLLACIAIDIDFIDCSYVGFLYGVTEL